MGMSDNHRVHQKTFKMFHEVFKSLSVRSVNHPIPNSKFKVLFTLYDPTHLFKKDKRTVHGKMERFDRNLWIRPWEWS